MDSAINALSPRLATARRAGLVRRSSPQRPALRAVAKQALGFTLIELLIVVGIITVLIALAIPAVLISRKRGFEIRVKADLTTISQSLDAYKADFGSYPVFADGNTIAAEQSSFANANWLDWQDCRGAVLLCRALIGPGPANGVTASNNTTSVANPGDDGADGPGFRVRRVANANGIQSGKVYGPYIDTSKFKVAYATDHKSGQPILPNFPAAYPVILDLNGTPILYYPATPGTTTNLGLTPPGTGTNSTSRFNGFDNAGFLDATSGGTSYSPTSSFAQLAANAGSLDYLLWTGGADTTFGLVNGKSDDITNFDLPGNLKK